MTARLPAHTKPCREAEAARQLANQSFKAYMPRIRLRRKVYRVDLRIR